MTRFFTISLLIILSILLISCINNDNRVLRKQFFFRMDTVVEVTISVPPRYNPTPLWRSVDSLLARCEMRFSATGDSSEINIINTRESNALPISTQLKDMLRLGIYYGKMLDGAFDITVLPLKELWGLCEQCGDSFQIPDSAEVSAALQSVGYEKIHISDAGDSVFFDLSATRIDLGGIAKGFVIKWLGALVRDNGVNDFLISAGGDIIVSGRRPDGAPWRVGVRHPRRPDELIDAIPVVSGAVFTSGDYERFRISDDGRRYHHIFDPSTGFPCGKNRSLTIRAPDPVRADILSTGLFCREPEEILSFVKNRSDLECLVVDSAGMIFKSWGW
jgi:thiamine biosynthesis lipoprotein